MTKSRIARKDYIDILKGICILAVVFLHYEEGVISSELSYWIGSFMVTGFYFASGWLFGLHDKRPKLREHIKKRLRSLGLPYLWFTLIILLFDTLIIALGYKEPKLLLIEIYKTITLRGIGTLWFLPALFGGEIIFTYLLDKNKYLTLLALIVSFLYLWAYEIWSATWAHGSELYRIIDAPFCTLHNISLAWIVVATAYYTCVKYRSSILGLSKAKLAILSMSLIFTSYFMAFKISPFAVVSFLVFHVDSIFLGPFAFMLLSLLTRKWGVNKFFIFWGKNSLILMVTHYSILLQISIILNTYWTGFSEFTGINTIYFFVLTILIEYPTVYFINSRAKFLLGKSYVGTAEAKSDAVAVARRRY